MVYLDVLIFDEKSDLNVYKGGSNLTQSGNEDASKRACCSTDCCNTEAPTAKDSKADSKCCATSCCDADLSSKRTLVALSTDYDLNQWAGESCLPMLGESPTNFIFYSRFL